MNKEQIELYQLKKKELTEEDKIYISGFKAAIDYMDRIKSDRITELMPASGNMGYMGRRVVDLMHDDMEERMINRLFYEIESCEENYAEISIPEEDDEDEEEDDEDDVVHF